MKNKITVETAINASLEKVWEYFTNSNHVEKWNYASPDWHCPKAENNLHVNGKFNYTMAAKDGSFSFDFWGTYTEIKKHHYINSVLGDNRQMEVSFIENGTLTQVVETFEAENENPIELQKQGWQAILDNFKNYTEHN